MSAREKKMYELQQRLRQSRKANENAVIAEKRRQQVLCWKTCLQPAWHCMIVTCALAIMLRDRCLLAD